MEKGVRSDLDWDFFMVEIKCMLNEIKMNIHSVWNTEDDEEDA